MRHWRTATLFCLALCAAHASAARAASETPLQRADRLLSGYFSIPNASAAVSYRFSDKELTVDGLEPGGNLLWFGIGRDRSDGVSTRVVKKRGLLTDKDLDGSVTLRSKNDIPPLSVFLLADIEHQEATILSPGRLRLHRVSGSVAQLRAGAKRWQLTGRKVHILWMRIGGGVWYQRFRDGGPNDRDFVGNGRMSVRLTDFEPQYPPEKPPPSAVASGDFFVLVDERSLRVLVVEVE